MGLSQDMRQLRGLSVFFVLVGCLIMKLYMNEYDVVLISQFLDLREKMVVFELFFPLKKAGALCSNSLLKKLLGIGVRSAYV